MTSNRGVDMARLALVVVLAAGCAATSPPSRQEEHRSGAQPPRPADVNLRGFSVAFQTGYADGCESGREGSRRREEGRYQSDADYKMGWNDGYSICAGRK